MARENSNRLAPPEATDRLLEAGRLVLAPRHPNPGYLEADDHPRMIRGPESRHGPVSQPGADHRPHLGLRVLGKIAVEDEVDAR
jgi:hypothetical protein